MVNILHTFNPEPIAFSIGPFGVHWYGLFLLAGILVGYWLVGTLAKRGGLSLEMAGSLYVNALIGGFFGARAYHVASDWGFYGSNPDQIVAVWNGGLAIHGAMLGALAVIMYYVKKRGLNFWKLADLFALPAILGQAIGRWGNYFNQELFGAPTDASWGIPINPKGQMDWYSGCTSDCIPRGALSLSHSESTRPQWLVLCGCRFW
ncbi:MAG: prolipoprotein diacylglyceryl transferase, partial [Parcubacteria group bacterium]|nr:prolipoprotein diacylglyceryl transferase [Parcubacteria group bacterium]